MPFVECCVPTCRSTKYDMTLFQFPRNEAMQQKWLDQIGPYCPALLKLSPNQVVKRLVCKRHFELKFLIGNKRLYHACPTLITEEEISTGRPLKPVSSEAASDHTYARKSVELIDHNYCKTPSSALGEPPAKVQRLLGDITTHNESFMSADLSTPPGPSGISITPPKEAVTKVIKGPRKPVTKRLRLIGSVKKLSPKCLVLYNKFKEVIKNKKLFGGTNKKNIEDAGTLSKTRTFEKIIDNFNTLQKCFFLMQLRTTKQKKKAKRYTLNEKLMCLALFKQSPKGYKLLQKIFSLPSKRTLNRILQIIPIQQGINAQFFHALQEKVKNWGPKRKLCSIVFDEVQLSTGLNFIPSSDIIYGFVPERDTPNFADHALVMMVRGICGSWRQPIAFYYCEGTMPSAQLAKILKDVIHNVSRTGLEPLCLICDQGVTNQGALKFLLEDTRRYQIKSGLPCDDTIEVDGKKLNVFFDPPHLLKGIRNNLLNKDMVFEGQRVRWQDILDVYHYDSQIGNIRMLPKLTDEHVVPHKIKKMKVSNCAKVISARVAATLNYTATFSQRADGTQVSTTTKNTADAITFFDKLFDSCNGSRGGAAPGKLRGPVKETSEHESFWQKSIKILENIKFIEKKNGGEKMKSVPSIRNWITTLKSHLNLKNILTSKGISFYSTRNLNQDPLENFFGKIRSHNIRNTNPNAYTFQNSFKSLLMTNMLSIHSEHSNCEDDVGATVVNLKEMLSHHPNTSACEIVENVNLHSIRPAVNVIEEKIKGNATAYTAGYVANKLCRGVKCNDCKKTIVTNETTNVHSLTSYRERRNSKKSLIYPSTQFTVSFSQFIEITNNVLEKNAQKCGISKLIKEKILKETNLDWIGCPAHKFVIKENFINHSINLQIFNWCRAVNLILCGKVQSVIQKRKLSMIQTLAFKKYEKIKKYKK